MLGYAFYAGLFACAGALVPRQEELQSSMTPLTMLILISFFVSFAVLDNPDGTLAHVTSFIPFSAPMTMPPRIALGEALGLRDRLRARDHGGVRRRADPAGGPDLQRRGAAHRLRGQAPRRLARGARPRVEPRLEGELLGARGRASGEGARRTR